MSYVIYVYSPSDFTTPPPRESGGQAAGLSHFSLTLKPGATGTEITVNDNDSIFNEIDGTQTLAETVNLDGTVYPAGTTVHTAYDLLNSGSGDQVTSVHFGGSGYQQGAVHGMVSSFDMIPGQTYHFDQERTSYKVDNTYDKYVSCFCAGTRIATAGGDVRVEDLQPGDGIVTMDDGIQPLRWSGARTVRGVDHFAPVRLRRGYLGLQRNLWVSQQHRMMLHGPRVELMFGARSAFVAARHLCDGHRARITPMPQVTYFHLMFNRHQVIFANGAASESFLPETAALQGLGRAALRELAALFPGLCAAPPVTMPGAARLCLKAYEAQALVA